MKLIKIAKLLSLLFVLSLMIISCSKDPVITEVPIEGEVEPTEEIDQNALFTRSVSSENGLDLDCFTILYPFDVIDSNDDTHTIASDEDFNSYFDEESETFIVDFVYPLTIEDEDENSSTIESGEELGEAFANCLPNGWEDNAFPAYLISDENSCLSLVYPVTVSDLEGENTTFDDEASFIAALAEEPLFFVFPITLVNLDGETIVANDVDELLTALFDCNGLDVDTTIWNDEGGFDFIGCYEISFPFSVELLDGTIVEVNDHAEYCDLLLEGNIQGYSFPMTLLDGEEEIVVNSQEELAELIFDCIDFEQVIGDFLNLYIGAVGDPISGFEPCYEISFPVSAQEIDWEGNILSEVSFTSLEEITELLEGGEFPLLNTVYPVTVTMNSTGEVVELQSHQELFELVLTCQ